MVRGIWVGKIAAGKMAQVLVLIPKVRELYMKYEGMPNPECFLNMFGESGILIWMADFNDLATSEKVSDQAFNDPEYHKLGEENANLFVEGSIHTYVLKNI